MRRAFVSLVALALLASTAPASAQLAPRDVERIDTVFARFVRPDGPGCIAGLARGDSLVWWRGYGLADVEARTPFGPRTVFSSGSIFKQFYSAALLSLAREGRLSMDDPARRWLPELPAYAQGVTVRMLADHTHGLREYPDLHSLMPAASATSDPTAVLSLLARQRGAAAAPGERLQYGNTGPALAALVIQRAAGEHVGTTVSRRVLDPAGMRSTAIGDTARPVPPRIPNYARRPDGSLARRPPTPGFRTTLEDLVRWSGALDRADAEWRELRRTLVTPSTLRDGTRTDYGLGIRVAPYRGLAREWAPGGTIGGRAMLMRFPDQGLTIALGCNLDMDPISTAEAVADVVLREEIVHAERRRSRPDVSVGALAARPAVGTYVSDKGWVLRVRERGGKVYLVFEGAEHELRPVTLHRFTIPGRPEIPWDAVTEVRFTPARQGAPRTLDLHTVWFPVRFTAVEPVDPATVVATDYVGAYASDELGSTLRVVARDGGLALVMPRVEERSGRRVLDSPGDQHVMEPVSRDLFAAGPQTVRFTRDGGRVTAAAVNRGHVPGLVFARQE